MTLADSTTAAAPLPAQASSTGIHAEIVEDHPVDENSSAITRVIVVAVDASSHSEHALHWAVENYVRPSTDLVVLMNVRPHIVTPGPYGSMFDFQEFVITAEEQQRTDSHQMLQDYARFLRRHKICCKAIALKGDARDELVKKVEEISPDAFIIGSRGLGAVRRTLLGSVSDYCIHHIQSCPVIIVKESPKAALHQKDLDFVSSTSFANAPIVPAALH
ncbi:hypothetical protein HDU67_002163 [Dinochytrium kinnereticum]|nr:hypothetical protein HDU67_002163 [Dinochytrium kinnereticum]